MTDCQHWYDPEIVDREKKGLQARVLELENKLTRIRDITEDIKADPVPVPGNSKVLLDGQRAWAHAISQLRGSGAYGGLFGGLWR